MWRICCATMISLKCGKPPVSSAESCAQAKPATSIRAASSAATTGFIAISSLAALLADRRQRFAAGFCMSILAGLVKRRASLCRIERRVDRLDPVHDRARLFVVNQHRIDAFDAAIGHQQPLRSCEE